ncbi:hypothetical protein EPN18_04570 [bacterium]|nr:MAG: hypothetical protein EPN18_04570 [bacterium]
MKYSLVIVAAMFSLCLSTDLINSFIKTSFFYNDSRHPGVILNINTTPQRPQFSDTRASFVVSPEYLPYQSARYLSILYRLPVAVSSVKENLPYELYKNMPRHVFFDSQQAHSFLPLPYNVNSSVVSQEVIEKDNELLLKVFPLSKGDSYVGFKTTEIENIRGAYVWFSVWIKSVAKARGSVQISIQDRDTGVNRSDDAFKANFYGNTGGWERVTVGKYIGNDSRYLSVKGVVTEKGMEAYFKNPIIEITPREDIKRDFEFALINKRWSSFLLQASYFNLVNSGIPPRVMEKIFAINGPLIQFKKDVIQLDDGLIPDYLKKLGDDSAIKLLAEKAFVDSVPLNNAGKTFADSGPEFSYSVRRYDYDFIELKVSSPSNGFLYWADGYNKNWHAYVNGAEMPVARANMNFKIIRLPKGESEVRFVYKADRFKYGLGLFYGALFAGVSVGLITYATGRKEN